MAPGSKRRTEGWWLAETQRNELVQGRYQSHRVNGHGLAQRGKLKHRGVLNNGMGGREYVKHQIPFSAGGDWTPRSLRALGGIAAENLVILVGQRS